GGRAALPRGGDRLRPGGGPRGGGGRAGAARLAGGPLLLRPRRARPGSAHRKLQPDPPRCLPPARRDTSRRGATGLRRLTRRPDASARVVEDDAERVAPPAPQAAHPVAHLATVGPASARGRPLVGGEDHELALPGAHRVADRLRAGTLLHEE